MYQEMKNRIEELGIQVIETSLNGMFGKCLLNKMNLKPIIHIQKGLDTPNKFSVLMHEATHASSFFTKRNWWMEYQSSYNKTFFYMEEIIALWYQKEISKFLGLQETYCASLSNQLFKRFSVKIDKPIVKLLDEENILINRWLKNTFKGVNNDFDRYLDKITCDHSTNISGSICIGKNSRVREYITNVHSI